MPEISEVRIMSEYINQVSQNKTFINIKKSEVSKIKTNLDSDWSAGFKLKSESRGKELILMLEGFNKSLLTNMGMSGNWVFIKNKIIPKHAHLIFETNDGASLCLVDVRRFAKWKWSETWSENRGPDPVKEYLKFKENILDNLNKKDFQKPIYELMMNQKYFNGIGNYLRSEILYRVNDNPFLDSKEFITKNPNLFDVCKDVILESYVLGGGQLKEWVNPFNEDKITFSEWLKCYGKKNMSTIIDKNNRKFWYNPKFDLSLVS
jgi:endonuclease VIII-like 1